MSMPNIPEKSGKIEVTLEESVNLILASIGYEELALAHILNAEGEKIQSVLGTLSPEHKTVTPPHTLCEVLQVNESVNKMLQNVMRKEFLLLMKLDSAKELLSQTKCKDVPK